MATKDNNNYNQHYWEQWAQNFIKTGNYYK